MIGTRAADLAGELRETGVVVLPEPLPSDFVETLREAFETVLEAYVAASDPNRGTRRHQMYLPFEGPFGDARLWANPTVLDVVEQVLGPDFECTYYGSDTPFPGSGYQPVHQDGGPLFPEWASRPPPYCIAMNVPLVDVTDDDGPLEWFDGEEKPGEETEPHRFTGPAGSILLRDTRVWHRGSPNRGAAPRPLLALLYTRDWFRFPLLRPAIDRGDYDRLPDPGRRLFRGAHITPVDREAGDRPRLSPDPE